MAKLRFRKRPKKEIPLEKKHARVLKIVTAINAVMFCVEASCGYFAHSTALISDSVDMLGDALGAGAGVLVRNSSRRKQAWVALAKAVGMGALGCFVLAGAAFLLANPIGLPVAATMAAVSGLALVANSTCAALLYRYRNDNINIKATLTCTRNDMISNACVMAAAGIGHFLVSPIPDIVVGMGMAALFIKSSISIGIESVKILRETSPKNQNKETQNTAVPPPKAEPKITAGFKKVIRSVFNRKAKADKKTPVAAPTERPPVADRKPARERVPADYAPAH